MHSDTNSWQCLQVRVTTFHSKMREDLEQAAVAPVFSVDPESIEVKPNERRRSELATLGPGQLIYTSVLNRVDWIWQSRSDVEPTQVALGIPTDVVTKFVSTLEQFVVSQNDLVRIAVGGLFGIPAADRMDGYRKLDELIDELTLDPENTSEFLYQINHPSEEVFANGEKIKFNNIEKWTCRQITHGLVSIASQSLSIFPDSMMLTTYATCELDINTDASNVNVFSSELSKEIFSKAKERILSFLDTKALRYES